MSEVDDMVREMALAFEELLGVELTEEQRVQVQARIIQQFGGERVYVPRRANFVMGGRFDLSGGPRAAMERYQISRATFYRLVRRRPK